MQIQAGHAENNSVLKKMQTAAIDGASHVNSNLDAQIVKGEDGQSMFDPQISSKRNLTDNASMSWSQVQKTQPDAQVSSQGKIVSGISEGDDVMDNKQTVDSGIAQELKQQEESYTDQIASLDIDNTTSMPNRVRESSAPPSASNDGQTVVEAADVDSQNSDQEFFKMD